MKDRRIHLRIKIKSLAAEARIIRAEAKKLKGLDKYDLNEHRTGVVRYHARMSQLAYAALRGVPYRVVEPRVRSDNHPSLEEVKSMALRFGADGEKLIQWAQEAQVHLKEQR